MSALCQEETLRELRALEPPTPNSRLVIRIRSYDDAFVECSLLFRKGDQDDVIRAVVLRWNRGISLRLNQRIR